MNRRRAFWGALLIVGLLSGCGGGRDAVAPEQPGATTCNRQTPAHGLVASFPGTSACLTNNDCNMGPKPACAAPKDNLCACTARSGSTCTAGRCVWHPNPANTGCVCVSGQMQQCTLSGGGTGVQSCNAAGTAWSTCS